MVNTKRIYTVTYGGWYQRTTLHLTEVYDFFTRGDSKLDLAKDKLRAFQQGLGLKEVSRESASLEFVKATTQEGIEIRYYEDGLYILELTTENIAQGHKTLEEYFENKFNPAIGFIFSLGAPTPKILANIQTTHPTVVSCLADHGASITFDSSEFGEVYTKISSKDTVVYKTPQYILIVAPSKAQRNLRDLVEMQIFFREFKDQLEKYLNIHRNIWEEISDIKEKQVIQGKDVDAMRGKLDSYQKTIALITNRINQMNTYVSTRSSIAKHLKLEEELVALLEYKYETLSDTLAYIKEIWKMTADYISSAVQNLVEIKNQSTSNNLKSLQTITSIGVISGVLGYLSGNNLPKISTAGLAYFVILFFVTWLMNYIIWQVYRNRKYSLKFGARASDL